LTSIVNLFLVAFVCARAGGGVDCSLKPPEAPRAKSDRAESGFGIPNGSEK